MEFKDYYQLRGWLEGFIPQTYSRKELGLERVKHLLKLLGNPQDRFKSIHIAGTSGKGSTAYYIARLLQGSGCLAAIKKRSANLETKLVSKLPPRSGLRLRRDLGVSKKVFESRLRQVFDWRQASRSMSNVKIGLHVSPHLVDIRERMQIFKSSKFPTSLRLRRAGKVQSSKLENGLMPMGGFIKLFNEIKPIVEKIQREKPDLTPSYFEILVAASFLYFAQEKVDFAVVEVGLGGRLDATNVLKPEVCVITNVGLDHTEILGKTIEKIAFEKAGIIKEGIPIITGATGKVLKVIEKVAKEKKAPLIKINTQNLGKTLKSDIISSINLPIDIFRLPYQNFASSNALLAIATAKVTGFSAVGQSIIEALSTTFPGRFEEIDQNVILDGAHNPDKISTLIHWIKATFDKKHLTTDKNRRSKLSIVNCQLSIVLVVAFKRGKEWHKMLDLLIKNLPVKKVVATKFHAVTDTGLFGALDPKEIRVYINKVYRLPTAVYNNSQEAVWEAVNVKCQMSNGKCLVIVTGSLYLVGEARTIWHLPDF